MNLKILDYSITTPEDSIPVDESIIVVGDSFKLIDYLPFSFASLIFIDPPYGRVVDIAWDKVRLEDFFTKTFSIKLTRRMNDAGSLYVCCGEGEKSDSYSHFKSIFGDRLHFKDHITISKERGIGNRKGWMYAREEMQWWVYDNDSFIWNEDAQYSTERRKRDGNGPIKPGQDGKERKSPYKRLTNVWADISFMTPDVVLRQKFHKTPKPVKLIERVILAHTKPGDIVFDCFAGAMTTWEACRRTGRRFVGIELSMDHVVKGIEYFEKQNNGQLELI